MSNTPPRPTPSPWKARVWAEYRVGNLTRAARDVLLTLATYRGTGGLCCPSHETLAERAKTCARTVGRALNAARDLGLVDWQHRTVRSLWRCLRTSNSYRLMVPSNAVAPIAWPIWRPPATTGLKARGEETKNLKGPWRAMLEEAARLPDLLAQRRETVEARQRAAMAR